MMADSDCVISIKTHFLSKNWQGNWKNNVETSADLTSTAHHRAERVLIKFMPTKIYVTPRNKVKRTRMTLMFIYNDY